MAHSHAAWHRTGNITLLVSLLGAPAAWVVLMSIGFVMASHACFPHEAPLTMPLWTHAMLGLVALGAGCFAGGLASALVAFRVWRRTQPAARGPRYRMNTGEGRARFLAVLGLMSSGLFVVAFPFTLLALWLVVPCHPW